MWHNLEETKPRLGELVLIANDYSMAVAELGENGRWEPCGLGGYDWEWYFTPTHWMELPKGPLK